MLNKGQLFTQYDKFWLFYLSVRLLIKYEIGEDQ